MVRKHADLFEMTRLELLELLEEAPEVTPAHFHGLCAQASARGEDDYDATFDALAAVVSDWRTARGLPSNVESWLIGPDVD